jgi:hypothetical protein
VDRLMRARILLAEAAALGVTIENLVAESSGFPGTLMPAPTMAQYVAIVSPSFSKGTAETLLVLLAPGGNPARRSSDRFDWRGQLRIGSG